MPDQEDETEAVAPEPFRPKAAFDLDAVKSIIQRYFRIYETEADIRGVRGQEIAAFYVTSEPGQFAPRFEELREAIRAHDPNLMVILQYRGGEDVILIARKPPVMHRGHGLNVLLFVLTILTTTLAGSFFYAGYEQAQDLLEFAGFDLTSLHPRYLALGFLSFSLPVMAILGIHELGHYFIAKRHRVRTSLPYFIPVPPIFPIGTFGAFISIREPIPDRKALFDIGAAGPIAGFIATIPVLILGLILTGVVAAPIPPEPEIHSTLASPGGETWGYGFGNENVTYENHTRSRTGGEDFIETITVNDSHPGFQAGTWRFEARGWNFSESQKFSMRVTYTATANHTPNPASNFVRDANQPNNFTLEFPFKELANDTSVASFSFDLPPNATAITAQLHWQVPARGVMSLGTSLLFWGVNFLIPTPDDVLIHPTGFAGWVGLLVTGFNLLPAGQLDGGHVARAVLGDNMRWASYASVAVMIGLSWWFAGWLILAILILFLGIRHPPPLNDKIVLDRRRKIMAAVVLLILVVSFIPIPFFRP